MRYDRLLFFDAVDGQKHYDWCECWLLKQFLTLLMNGELRLVHSQWELVIDPRNEHDQWLNTDQQIMDEAMIGWCLID